MGKEEDEAYMMVCAKLRSWSSAVVRVTRFCVVCLLCSGESRGGPLGKGTSLLCTAGRTRVGIVTHYLNYSFVMVCLLCQGETR